MISPQPPSTNARPTHPMKNMVPLEPLKIDPTAAYYYLPNTSPQPRPSPQPRVVHNTPSMVSYDVIGHFFVNGTIAVSIYINRIILLPQPPSGLLSHSAVQPAHYIHPQYMYHQQYIQESSLTPYHHQPATGGEFFMYIVYRYAILIEKL